jgi:hypothetical protein
LRIPEIWSVIFIEIRFDCISDFAFIWLQFHSGLVSLNKISHGGRSKPF